jgi:hypothetical protein
MISRFIVACSLAAAAVAPAVMLSPAASASPVPPACPLHYACTYIYYNNLQHTTQVGGKFIDCLGDVNKAGTTTQWFTFSDGACS